MAAQIKETAGACENITGTMGFADHDFLGRVYYLSMTDMYRKELDAAHMKVVTGATDYMTAIRASCNKLAASGVRTIDYESGHSDRVEVAVRRALMTSVSHITQRISEQNAEELGADGWEISAHSGARPSHAIYQGRQFPAKDYERIVKPLIEDYNCRHSAFPIIIGISEPVYTEKELEEIDPKPFTYEGRTYTAYQAQQQMRKMERAMRKQKDRCITADAAGDKDGFTTASIKLRRQKDIYEKFCKAADSYTQYERTFVAGYDRRLAGKTGAVTRKQRAFQNAQLRLKDVGNGNTPAPQANGGATTTIDVTNEYLRAATPGKGNITFDTGYDKSKHKDEIKTADWLLSTFGGDIKLLKESQKNGEKMADFMWNKKYWELKGTHSVNGADKLLQHAVKQIKDKPGGVILNVLEDLDITVLEEQLTRCLLRSNIDEMDIMLLSKGNLLKTLRYKK